MADREDPTTADTTDVFGDPVQAPTKAPRKRSTRAVKATSTGTASAPAAQPSEPPEPPEPSEPSEPSGTSTAPEPEPEPLPETAPAKRAPRKRTARATTAPVPVPDDGSESAAADPAVVADEAPVRPVRTSTRKRTARAVVTTTTDEAAASADTTQGTTQGTTPEEAPADMAVEVEPAPAEKSARRSRKPKKQPAPEVEPAPEVVAPPKDGGEAQVEDEVEDEEADATETSTAPPVLFQPPAKPSRRRRAAKVAPSEGDDVQPDDLTVTTPEAPADADDGADDGADSDDDDAADAADASEASDTEGDDENGGAGRRRRRRGGRRRRKGPDGADGADGSEGTEAPEVTSSDASEVTESASEDGTGPAGSDQGAADGASETTSRRRRRRRRTGEDGDSGNDDPEKTVTRVRSSRARSAEDEITAVSGSTRLEAKKQRRREGREAGRRRAPIVSEAEFLARREAVDRVMAIRQREDVTQIAVLEDQVLVEHYVARESQTSLIGNVYLGRVQNVLPSMEAAFIDIGKGRNAVLYAGEVNWSALGHQDGQARKIESVLTSGQSVLVQVTKDPVGHKGARLTSQVSLAGRFLVYVPDGTTSGISRKLPDTERNRLKTLLKEIVPDSAGVIVRTAAEGASEEDLTRDVERLRARWEDIEKKSAKGNSPQLLYGEPDLTLKVVRDLFTEDFGRLVVDGDDAWDTVHTYVEHVASDLEGRLERYDRYSETHGGRDLFAHLRIDEQIHKGLDRKVWLPSGGSLVIDRTEAMTVVDVNTGKFTGSGGNLEETVTKNNLEAAEEIVRQLRLRDIGGIIVVDFIDMVLESNRDLVLRRLVECLGRDRTRHQVAEVTSLGLIQMTRKRIGTGLLEAFTETCDHCQGRGLRVLDAPVEPRNIEDGGRARRSRRGRSGDDVSHGSNGGQAKPVPSPRDVAAMARPETTSPDHDDPDEVDELEDLDVLVPDPIDQPTDGPADGPADVADDQPDDVEPAPEPAPEPERAPVEPAAPRVVTRTRRRAASRPAGPPVSIGTVGSASATTGSVGEPPAGGTVEPGTADLEPALAAADGDPTAAPAVSHVPVKRKGRKR